MSPDTYSHWEVKLTWLGNSDGRPWAKVLSIGQPTKASQRPSLPTLNWAYPKLTLFRLILNLNHFEMFNSFYNPSIFSMILYIPHSLRCYIVINKCTVSGWVDEFSFFSFLLHLISNDFQATWTNSKLKAGEVVIINMKNIGSYC
jgi:hypothetical protein